MRGHSCFTLCHVLRVRPSGVDVSSIHVHSGLHALSGMDGCIVRILAVLAVPFVRLHAVRGGSSFIPHEAGGQGALHGSGRMLRQWSTVADIGGSMGGAGLLYSCMAGGDVS